MATLNPQRTRSYLEAFNFQSLFVEELGWSNPASRRAETVAVSGTTFTARPIAQLGGVVVFEVTASGGTIPDAPTRAALHKQLARLFHETLLIFRDGSNTQTLWYWVKRDGNRSFPRSHLYVKGQPGDLFLSKLAGLQFELADFDERGDVGVVRVVSRLRDALDVERVTKRFYNDFNREQLRFIESIEGIDDERDRRWYASVLLNRLMFIYFLQRKGFLDRQNYDYLQRKLEESQQRDPNRFYAEFLRLLFFEAFAKPEVERDPATTQRVGQIPYLNGSLFLPHRLESDARVAIRIPDAAFERLFELFGDYSWNLNDTPGGDDNEINPDVLGYIFEKYINNKAFGAYYTRPEITEYLCEQTIHRLLLDRVEAQTGRRFAAIEELLISLDAPLCGELLHTILPRLSLLDPACGSGAFLVAAMKTLINVYAAIIGKVEFLGHRNLSQWLADVKRDHPSIAYFIKKRIISDNLFGVDLMEEATEIAKLRLYLALVASAQRVEELEPLPNVDFNLLAGNSLVGLLRLDDTFDRQTSLFDSDFHDKVKEKRRLVDTFRHTATSYRGSLQGLRDAIQGLRDEARPLLNEALLDQFRGLGIQYEQATWDVARNKEGRATKRALRGDDLAALHPFHWGYEFSEVMNERGGFDAIITNPPWDVFQTDEKEFFKEYQPTIQKNKLRIEDWKRQQAILMRNPELRQAWLDYSSRFPHQARFFKNAPQYQNQISVINERNVGSKINLYSYFVEQCYNLLRDGGLCGIVIPSGIYTDLGTSQLRRLLFNKTEITGLFGFENRKRIFEEVDTRFKFVVLSFRKGGSTEHFPVAFMRHDVEELARFPKETGVQLTVQLIKELSPDSLSLMELNDLTDVAIAKKMAQWPLLGDQRSDVWNVSLTSEFNMTTASDLFHTAPAPGRLPLYEGKMIHQFDAHFSEPRYWVDERAGRAALLGRAGDHGQTLDYQRFRLGFRDIASSTNERTMISTLIPRTFHGNKLPTVIVCDDAGNPRMDEAQQLYLCAVWNSFVFDWLLRQRVTTTLNFFYIYQMPAPRLTASDRAFAPIVERAAKLICTTPEFDQLAQAVGLRGHADGVTNPVARARLRAELDGMVAHLYGLTEAEFQHILATFPLVDEPTKVAALNAFRALTPLPGDPEIARLIQDGESDQVEFKVAARWNRRDPRGPRLDDGMKANIIKAVAGMMNGEGGTLLIGVRDNGTVEGIEPDMQGLRSRDEYQLFLINTLSDALGAASNAFFRVTFHEVDRKTVCRITIQPSSEYVFYQNQFYVRSNNSTRALNPQETARYTRAHPR